MKYEIEIKKTLRTDNSKSFGIGSDIAFTLFNAETTCHDRYIGEIEEITDDSIVIGQVEINKNKIAGKKIILLQDIESNSCNYVYYD